MSTPNLEEIQDNMFLGKECKHGHGRLRYKKNQKCVQCDREYHRKKFLEKYGRPPSSRTCSKARGPALKDGKTTFMGLPCQLGHSGLRYTSNSNCVECLKLNAKKRQKQGAGLRYKGKPCKYGHSGWRYSASSGCIECQKLRLGDKQLYAMYRINKIRTDPVAYEQYKMQMREYARRYRMTEKFSATRAHWLAKRRNTLQLIYPELAR